jgi:antitoxin component HigA of HigAB toxin-antitoxin module
MESDDMTESKADWRATLLSGFAAERGAQMKFAREVRCSESHLSLVLSGQRGLSYHLATRIHAKTGIPVEELMSPPLAPDGSDPQ